MNPELEADCSDFLQFPEVPPRFVAGCVQSGPAGGRKSMSNGDLNNVTVQPAGGGAAILAGRNGTLANKDHGQDARTGSAGAGGWLMPPVPGQQYRISATNKSPLDATCSDFQQYNDRHTGNLISEGTFNIV